MAIPTNMDYFNKLLGEQLGGGGGGSSDFSTAQVTVVNNGSTESEISVSMATAQEATPPFVPNAQSNVGFSIYSGEEVQCSAILYKGRCSCGFIGATSASGTGAIERINSVEAIITGDCTITIS